MEQTLRTDLEPIWEQFESLNSLVLWLEHIWHLSPIALQGSGTPSVPTVCC